MAAETPRKRIAIIGAGMCDAPTATFAYDLGKRIAEVGWDIVCGGLGGVMAAACKGANQAGGVTIGILPGDSRDAANPWVQTAIATGLGPMRNYLVVLNADVVVAVAGESGTLSELALAKKIAKTVIAWGRWSALSDVIAARDIDHVMELIDQALAENP